MGRRSGRNPKSPAFQFYPGDFLGDSKVQAMRTEEVGAYLLLLCAQWMDGPLPDDHEFLRRLCRMDAEPFKAAWVVLSRCFHPVQGRPGFLENPRLEREREFQSENRERRKAASEAANAVKRDRIGTESEPNRSPIGTRPVSDSVPTLTRNPTPVPDPLRPSPVTLLPEEQVRAPRAAAEPPCAAVPAKRKRADPTGPDAEFREWWLAEFQAKTGRPYSWSFGKDSKLLSTMLKSVGLEETKSRASRLLHAPPEWLVEGGVDIGTLSSQFNKLAAMGALTPTNGVREAVIRAASQHTQDALPFLPTTPKRR